MNQVPVAFGRHRTYVGQTDNEPRTMEDDASHYAQRQLGAPSPWDEPRPSAMPRATAARRRSLVDNVLRPRARGPHLLRAIAPGLVFVPFLACAGSSRSASSSSGWWCFTRKDGIASCEPERSTCEDGSTRWPSVIADGSCRWHAHASCARFAVTSPAQIGEREHCTPTMAECELAVARRPRNADEGPEEVLVQGCVER